MQNTCSCFTLWRCTSDLFVFPAATSTYQSWGESHPFVGFQPPSIRSCRAAHVQPRARAHSPAVCTRKRRGDGKHVCAMRTGIGVSLFRGGSDVLFHPRRRQSCRIAKTYHTIVSKFTHSLISRSFYRYLSFSVPPFSPAVFPVAFRWLFYISLSSLVFTSYHFLHLVFSSSSSTPRLLFYSSSRFYLSRIPSVRGGVSWYAPAKFSAVPFARRTGRHRMKCASCRLRLCRNGRRRL